MGTRTGVTAQGEVDRAKRYLLVVDNEVRSLLRTAMVLQRFAYPVCTAQTARQAADMVSIAEPALIIASLDLPGMSGMDLLRLLGRDARLFSLPVILLLPADDASVEKRSIEIGGGVTCLTKPVGIEDLYRAVQAAVETTPRANVRIPTRLPVTLNGVSLDRDKGECATNLSELGAYVRMRRPLRKNERIEIRFELGDRSVTARASVLYHHRFDDGKFREQGMAVKFVEIKTEDRDAIRRYIRTEVTRGITARKG